MKIKVAFCVFWRDDGRTGKMREEGAQANVKLLRLTHKIQETHRQTHKGNRTRPASQPARTHTRYKASHLHIYTYDNNQT